MVLFKKTKVLFVEEQNELRTAWAVKRDQEPFLSVGDPVTIFHRAQKSLSVASRSTGIEICVILQTLPLYNFFFLFQKKEA
jgi:hypothetical protein